MCKHKCFLGTIKLHRYLNDDSDMVRNDDISESVELE